MRQRAAISGSGHGALGIVLALITFFLPATVHAASLYWVGAAGGSIATATNWLTTDPTACGGGNASAAPGSTDTAIFDADCDNSAAVDASWTVQGININSGYTGTVTQSASTTVTIGTANYTQADGTFTDAANATSTIDINNGTFSLSGGTFSNTGATSSFTFDRNFTVSGGTFTNTSNTITFDGAESADDSTITCTGTLSGTVAVTMAGSGNSTFTVASGCTISLGASPTTTFANNSSADLTNNGTITVSSGTWTVNNATANSSGPDLINNGTITHSGTGWDINDVGFINNANATTTYSGTSMTVERTFTQSGTFDLTGITVTLDGVEGSVVTCGTLGGTLVISKSGSSANASSIASGCTVSLGASPTTTLTNDAGADFTNNGTITISSGTWTVNNVTTNNATPDVINNGTITHNGTTPGWDLNDVGLLNNAGATVTYTGTTLTIEGNFTQSGTFDLTGITVTLNGSGNNDDSTVTCGTLGGTLVISKSGTGNPTATIASGCTVSLGASPTTTLANDANADFTNNGTITISSGTWTVNNTTANGTTVDIINSGTITHNGASPSWDINDVGLINNASGTITYTGTALTVERTLTQNGTFDLSGITVTLDGANNNDDATLTCGSTIQGAITINKTDVGGNTTPSGNCTIQGAFTRTDGPIANPASAATWTLEGSLSMSTTDTFGGANLTVVMGGSGTQTITQNAGSISGPFNVNKTGSNAVSLSTALTTGSTCNIVEGVFDLASFAFTCGSTFTLEDGGTFRLQGGESTTTPTINSTSTVTYNGTATYTVNNWDYNNLTISGTGTFNLGAAESLGGNLTLTNGTFSANGNTLTVTGTGSIEGGTYQTSTATQTHTGLLTVGGGTVTMSTGTLTLNGGLTVSGGTFTGSTGTTDVNGALTISSGTFTAPSSSGTFSVSGNFTHSAGTFTHNSGTLTLDGTNQTLSGASTFNNLTKTVTTARTLTFPSGTGSTQTVVGTWTAQGASGALLSLRSSTSGTQWRIDPQGTRTLSYIDVQDSNNTNATSITTAGFNMTDSGNNTNWSFNSAPSTTVPSDPSQATDGTGYVTFTTRVSDSDNNTTRLQVEYSPDDGSSWKNAYISSVKLSGGAVNIDNASTTTYQITGIDTNQGNIELTITWDSKSTSNEGGAQTGRSSLTRVRVLPNDSTASGTVQQSSRFTLDNEAPRNLSGLTTSSTKDTITLSWSDQADDEAFSHYEAWYGTTKSAVTGRTSAAKEWDSDNDSKLTKSSTKRTTISSLSPGTTYYVQLSALDTLGNRTSLDTLTVDTEEEEAATVVSPERPAPITTTTTTLEEDLSKRPPSLREVEEAIRRGEVPTRAPLALQLPELEKKAKLRRQKEALNLREFLERILPRGIPERIDQGISLAVRYTKAQITAMIKRARTRLAGIVGLTTDQLENLQTLVETTTTTLSTRGRGTINALREQFPEATREQLERLAEAQDLAGAALAERRQATLSRLHIGLPRLFGRLTVARLTLWDRIRQVLIAGRDNRLALGRRTDALVRGAVDPVARVARGAVVGARVAREHIQQGSPKRLVITDVAVTKVSPTGATVVWTTNKLSRAKVNWGETTSYGAVEGEEGGSVFVTEPRRAHAVTLSTLNPGQKYYFEVVADAILRIPLTKPVQYSWDDPNVAVEANYTFTTPLSLN